MSLHETVPTPVEPQLPRVAGDGRALTIAVIGGGITGLAAAHRLLELAGANGGARVEIELFEASPRLGGCFGTEQSGEYVIETGADSFVTDKPAGIELCRRLGLESRLIGIDPAYRRALIVRGGRTWPVPSGLSLLAPSSVRGLLRTPLLSPIGKLRAVAEYVVPPRRTTHDESIAAFAIRRFGREMYERVLQPLVGGIYTGDPAQLSLAATFPRFIEMERRSGGLIRGARNPLKSRSSVADSGVRYGLFASFQNGMSELQEALRARLVQSNVQIHSGDRVTAVRRLDPSPPDAHGRFEVELLSSEKRTVDAVIVAVPAFQAAELIAPQAVELAGALREIEYASSAIVVTGHRLADIGHPLNAAGLVIPHSERRKVLAVSFLSRKFPGRAPADRVILRTFVGGALQPALLSLDAAELSQLVQSELRELLGVTGEPEFARVVRYDRAMPQYALGHVERVQRIEQLVTQVPGLELAGNAYHGVGVPDCIQSGEDAAERVWARIARKNQDHY